MSGTVRAEARKLLHLREPVKVQREGLEVEEVRSHPDGTVDMRRHRWQGV